MATKYFCDECDNEMSSSNCLEIFCSVKTPQCGVTLTFNTRITKMENKNLPHTSIQLCKSCFVKFLMEAKVLDDFYPQYEGFERTR